jgi:SAM-dependent methyltransferase
MQHQESYSRHDEHLRQHLQDEGLRELALSWMRTDTVDHWRHKRMLDSVTPLLERYPGAQWLTVGDGRWGRDARYILDRGGVALATDISESLLQEGKRRNYIPAYRVENAERLTLADGSFDFVLCKESYHHLPRPAVALYEMLRVARVAVVLIEPQDEYPPRLLTRLKVVIKRLAGRDLKPGYHSFEEWGNYVYTVSERELTKAALAVGLTHIAFKPMNSFYVSGGEHEVLSRYNRAYLKIRLMIVIQDALTALGAVHAGLLVAILFKGAPDSSLESALRQQGFRLPPLPENPFHETDGRLGPGSGAAL